MCRTVASVCWTRSPKYIPINMSGINLKSIIMCWLYHVTCLASLTGDEPPGRLVSGISFQCKDWPSEWKGSCKELQERWSGILKVGKLFKNFRTAREFGHGLAHWKCSTGRQMKFKVKILMVVGNRTSQCLRKRNHLLCHNLANDSSCYLYLV